MKKAFYIMANELKKSNEVLKKIKTQLKSQKKDEDLVDKDYFAITKFIHGDRIGDRIAGSQAYFSNCQTLRKKIEKQKKSGGG
jgi:hypothetical protein